MEKLVRSTSTAQSFYKIEDKLKLLYFGVSDTYYGDLNDFWLRPMNIGIYSLYKVPLYVIKILTL